VTGNLDIVIPTLNAASGLERTLAALANFSIIVSDGGSTDGTLDIARRFAARIVSSPPGRGMQLATGAQAATAPWLFFLHADTVPQAGWAQAIAKLADGEAGYFRLRFDSIRPAARRLERLAAWRCRTFGLPYGDQGLVISRTFYERVGGFRDLVLMEDVDLVRRIGRANLVPLDAEVVTSAQRYERDGWLLRPLRNLSCLALYFGGLPVPMIERLYR
jgi:rSAM/selenodomain-associated transferase 2